MPATLIAYALISLTRPDIPVSVDASPGDSISGIHQFNIKLGDSRGLITQVEFYVNHELRDTNTSIPYNFKLDTINEEEEVSISNSGPTLRRAKRARKN